MGKCCIGNVDQGLGFGIEMGGFGREGYIHLELAGYIRLELVVMGLSLGSCSLGICLVPGFGLGVGRPDCSLHWIFVASAIHVGVYEETRVGHLGRQWARPEGGSLSCDVGHLPGRSCYLASVRKGCKMTLVLELKINF